MEGRLGSFGGSWREVVADGYDGRLTLSNFRISTNQDAVPLKSPGIKAHGRRLKPEYV